MRRSQHQQRFGDCAARVFQSKTLHARFPVRHREYGTVIFRRESAPVIGKKTSQQRRMHTAVVRAGAGGLSHEHPHAQGNIVISRNAVKRAGPVAELYKESRGECEQKPSVLRPDIIDRADTPEDAAVPVRAYRFDGSFGIFSDKGIQRERPCTGEPEGTFRWALTGHSLDISAQHKDRFIQDRLFHKQKNICYNYYV